MDVQKVLSTLSQELSLGKDARELYICGGAALNLLGISSRQTADIDVLDPKLDQSLIDAASRVAAQLGLHKDWLNNGSHDLVRYLNPDWQERATLVFKTPTLRVFSLDRMDLLNSKIWAACDRLEDIPDVVAMAPTDEELQKAQKWVLQCDASEIWPDIVEQCLTEIRKRLNNERTKR